DRRFLSPPVAIDGQAAGAAPAFVMKIHSELWRRVKDGDNLINFHTTCSWQSWSIGPTGNNSIYINVWWRDAGKFGLPIHPADLARSAQELSPRYRHCYLAWNLPNTRPPSLEAGGM